MRKDNNYACHILITPIGRKSYSIMKFVKKPLIYELKFNDS